MKLAPVLTPGALQEEVDFQAISRDEVEMYDGLSLAGVVAGVCTGEGFNHVRAEGDRAGGIMNGSSYLGAQVETEVGLPAELHEEDRDARVLTDRDSLTLGEFDVFEYTLQLYDRNFLALASLGFF